MSGEDRREYTLDECVEPLPETHSARAELRRLRNDLANALEVKRRRGIGIGEREKVIEKLRDRVEELERLDEHVIRVAISHGSKLLASLPRDVPGGKSKNVLRQRIVGLERERGIIRRASEAEVSRLRSELTEARTDAGIEREEAERSLMRAEGRDPDWPSPPASTLGSAQAGARTLIGDLGRGTVFSHTEIKTRIEAAFTELEKRRDKANADAERLRVQLAGCIMAAEGSRETAPDVLPEYADCLAVRTVHELRAKMDKLRCDRDQADALREDADTRSGAYDGVTGEKLTQLRREFEELKERAERSEAVAGKYRDESGSAIDFDRLLTEASARAREADGNLVRVGDALEAEREQAGEFERLLKGRIQELATVRAKLDDARAELVNRDNILDDIGGRADRVTPLNADLVIAQERIAELDCDVRAKDVGLDDQRALIDEYCSRIFKGAEVERELHAEIDCLHGRIGNLQSKLKHPKYHLQGAGKRARAEIVQLKKDRRALWRKLVAAKRAVGGDSKSPQSWEAEAIETLAREIVKNRIAEAVNRFYADNVVPAESTAAIIAIYTRLVEALKVHVNMCLGCAGFGHRRSWNGTDIVSCLTCGRARDVLAECEQINKGASSPSPSAKSTAAQAPSSITKPEELVKCSVCSKLIPLERASDSGMCGSCEMENDAQRESDPKRGEF